VHPPARRTNYPRIGLIALTGLAVVAATAAGVGYLGRRPGAALAGIVTFTAAPPSPTPSPAASPSPSPAPASPAARTPVPLLQPHTVRIDTPGFWSYALLTTSTGAVTGSKNLAATSTTASMIKAWIAADYLRRAAESRQTPSGTRLADLSRMIRDSDNNVASEVFDLVGADASIRRLVSICRLTETRTYRTYWSNTMVSARDTARMAACIGDGRAAGPQWTKWVLAEMRAVRGTGNFGIRRALPPEVSAQTAIKNGWVARSSDGNWHIACLAIGDGWTLGVLARYPAGLGFTHGTRICQSVADQLVVRPR
jgi:hypothetical protein